MAVAAPILERYGLEATLFLATGPPETGQLTWIDRTRGCPESLMSRIPDSLPRQSIDRPTASGPRNAGSSARYSSSVGIRCPGAVEGL